MKAKELYTELGMTLAELRELGLATGLALEIKAWNTTLSDSDAAKIRAAKLGSSVLADIGLAMNVFQEVAGALKIDITNPTSLDPESIARIKSCKLAHDLATELKIPFVDLLKLGSKIGIEIGRAGYKGLSSAEKLLLKATHRTQFGVAKPEVAAPQETEKPRFAAPTGNKAVEASKPAPRTTSTPRPETARDNKQRPGTPAPKADDAAARPGAGKTGRQRFEVKESSYASQRHGGGRTPTTSAQPKTAEAPVGPITVELPLNLRQLSEALGIKVNDIMARLLKEGAGFTVRINDSLSAERIQEIGMVIEREINIKAPKSAEELIESALEQFEDDTDSLKPRAPIVTIMGHVDHGKTSLLDAINRMDRAAGEAGGITQHIGAFRVSVAREGDEKPMEVTFIDTPGHAAFTQMRARGAQVTDVAVIVVAADDGVMPQTIEAINHARAAKVEIVVAINKIDKAESNVARTRQMLATHNLMSPDWGGTTEIVEVSAAKGTGIQKLIETLSDLTDLLELKANPNKPAVGRVIESHRSEGRGIVATVLVQEGTLGKGQAIVAGHGYGRVRAMYDSRGIEMETAPPSWPVQVTGLSELPEPGARFHGLDDLKKAQEIAARVTAQERELSRAFAAAPLTLEQWSKSKAEHKTAELVLVLKADVQGTCDTIQAELQKFVHDEVSIKVIHSAVGVITTTDVHLAEASGAIIVGFNTNVQPTARELADNHHVDIRLYDVIYKLLEDIHAALSGLLKPEEVEVEQGRLVVRQIFKASKLGVIAGCFVEDGMITRGSRVRVYRGKELIFDGPIDSLKRFKDEAKDVREGFECGVVLHRFSNVEVGDVLKAYTIETRERTLNAN